MRLEREKEKLEKPGPPTFSGDDSVRRLYGEVYSLWNRNETVAAAEKWESFLRDTARLESFSKHDQIKAWNLAFGIFFELGNAAGMHLAVERMRDRADCHADTIRNGLLFSLWLFNQGQYEEGDRRLKDVCIPSDSPHAALQRQYWHARFLEARNDPGARDAYLQLAAVRVPTYYSFLAQFRLDKRGMLPAFPDRKEARVVEISINSKEDEWLSRAEQLLRVDARKDASRFLGAVSGSLRSRVSEDTLPALLYTAQMLHGSGHHLEAFRIYSDLIPIWTQRDLPADLAPSRGLVEAMFPRPYASAVEPIAHYWKVDSNLIYAIMRQESAFNPLATSSADARGLLQLMPAVARQLAKQWGFARHFQDRTLYMGDVNLRLAVFHLSQAQAVSPNLISTIAAYNAGVRRVAGWWQRWGNYPPDLFVEFIPVPETQNYVKLVLRNYLYYRILKTGEPVPDAILAPYGSTSPVL